MPEFLTCQKCGAPLCQDARLGCCPSCLFTEASGNGLSSGDEPDPSPVLRRMGDYELLEVLGRGGMGVVYKARQISLGRHVAVKLLIAGELASPEFIKRLRVEATTAGSLQHPNIVGIHEIGIHQDQHYLVMDYVVGTTLAARIGSSPMPARTAAGLLKTIAEAVHHAHMRGVLHRDLKPSNILLDEQDQPRITDFGLAKRFTSESITTEPLSTAQDWITLEGQVVGSPNYMPPEQASPDHSLVSRAGDVYSLGAILYHMLTGRPPFLGETIPATLRAVVEDEPIAPRLLNPAVPVDLETICLKCLEKEPERRYPTALELGQDLDAFLTEQPIRARPVSRSERIWRWCRRHRLLSATLGLSVMLLLTLVVGSQIAAARLKRARDFARSQEQRALAGESNALHQVYIAQMNLAQKAWMENDVERVRRLLADTETSPDRGFEWYFWQQQLHLETRGWQAHAKDGFSISVLPDGRHLATCGHEPSLILWDLQGDKILDWTSPNVEKLSHCVFSPDGRVLLVGGELGHCYLIDAATGNCLATLRGHTSGIWGVAYSPDGRHLASASWDGTARIWSAEGEPLHILTQHRAQVMAVDFSPDGQMLATASLDKTIRLWDVATGELLQTFPESEGSMHCLQFSPDGKALLTGGEDRVVRLLDILTGRVIQHFRGHEGAIRKVQFSRDGSRVLTASNDRTARLWMTETGAELKVFKGHQHWVPDARFTRDESEVITGCTDGTLKLWPADRPHEALVLKGHSDVVFSAAYSRNGAFAATGSGDRTARVWDTATGRELRRFTGHEGPVKAVALSPDGQRLVTAADREATVRLWDVGSGRELGRLKHPEDVMSLSYAPHGDFIVTGCSDANVRLWDLETKRVAPVYYDGVSGPVWGVAFSWDGALLAAAQQYQTVRIWETRHSKPRHVLWAHKADMTAVAFTPDNKHLLTAGRDRLAKVFDVATGREVLVLAGHPDIVNSVCASPDGRRYLTGSEDGTAKLWDAQTGRELLTLHGHHNAVTTASFSPDGHHILTAGRDHTARIWAAATSAQVAEWARQQRVSSNSSR